MGDDESRLIVLPGSEVPNWFSHKRIGSSISFHVPSISKGEFLRLLVSAVCIFYETRDSSSCYHYPTVRIKNETRGNFKNLRAKHSPTLQHIFPYRKEEDHFFLYLTPLIRNKYKLESGLIFNELMMESGDEIKVSFRLWKNAKAKKCGVHVVVDKPNVK
jgi:hypothetical protein